jgi:two-component system KDP operon response regulator KdpE
MKPTPIILIIDSDKASRRLLRNILQARRYRVCETESGQTGIQEAAARGPDVIILELELADTDGITVLRRLREWNQSPILVVSSRDGESDKVLALDSGANDYLTKPFGSEELLARLRVLQRTLPTEPDGPLFIHGNLKVDLNARVITCAGRIIDLTPTEQAIFYTLLRHAGKLVSSKHLLRCVWGTDSETKLRDLHVYIVNLRRKLRKVSEQVLIHTEGSQGYRVIVPPANAKETEFERKATLLEH